jgi:hypothetical protein
MMQVIVLANAGLRTGDGLTATKDTVLRARLTDPSIAGQKPPRTPTHACARTRLHRFARPADRPLSQREGQYHG